MKRITFRLVEQKTYEKPFIHTCEIQYEASLDFDNETSFADFFDNLDKVKEMLKIARKAITDRRYFEFVIDEWVGDSPDFTTKSFNRWVSVPTYEQGEEGIYFQPDIKYTSPNRDMYIQSAKTMIKDLAFTLG